MLTLGINYVIDNANTTSGAITPNDGYLFFLSSVAVTMGQTVTILPGSLTFDTAGPGFSPPPAVFNGNVFLTDNSGGLLSNLGSANAVPEPSTWALLGLGTLGLCAAALRRRVRAA